VITADVTSQTDIDRLIIQVTIKDSCGASYETTRRGYEYYTRTFRPRSTQFLYAEPLKAISYLNIQAWLQANEDVYEQTPVAFWIDDIVYRKNDEKLRGCKNCGYRGMEWCEHEGIQR
jgi:hypothetical protein